MKTGICIEKKIQEYISMSDFGWLKFLSVYGACNFEML